MNIYILEDDFILLKKIERFVREIVRENQWLPKAIVDTTRPEEIIQRLQNAPGPHVYLLDIEIKGYEKSGLELAEEIRKRDVYGTISFISSHVEFASITYQYRVEAYDFIDKSLEDDKLKERVRQTIERQFRYEDEEDTSGIFHFSTKYSDVKLPIRDIIYFETANIPHKVKLVRKENAVDYFYSSLSEVNKKNEYLYLCHRSFIVNVLNVERIKHVKKDYYAIMSDGNVIPIARSRVKELIQRVGFLRDKKQ
ncbi:two component transcriptional regulator, LytTR family [Pilibacter termitis]|uniref:Two component transcriptional regulator, LytTR family n=1 Tax=Pilibacter termitis TaxID=263852 RepID=A0A1T4KF64_9ENTE|nr:LytTR family DNA-binding domain-containing protein [Pilibacter termitis]SJZ41098.1 two component transcriptional regulator, LytTR family [Pilibacter termitis]